MRGRKRGQSYFSRGATQKPGPQHRKITLTPFSSHAVYELAPDLLLVFKPRGHLEIEHAHDYNQRVRLIRGKLEIRYAARGALLGERSRAATIPAGRRHATRALLDTWLIVEKLPRAARGDA